MSIWDFPTNQPYLKKKKLQKLTQIPQATISSAKKIF